MEIKIKKPDGNILTFQTKHIPNKSTALEKFKSIHKESIKLEGWEILPEKPGTKSA